MARTARHAATSAGMLLILAGAAGAITMRNWDLLVHQRGDQVQHATAAEAVLSEDGERILASDVLLRARMGEESRLRARAPQGIFVIGGIVPLEQDKQHIPSYREVVGYLRFFDAGGFHGDLLLDGVDGDTVAELDEEGLLTSRYLIWSERYDRFLSPSDFRQTSTLDDGGAVEIRGGALSVDRDFRDWTYFGGDEEPVMLTYEAPPEEDEEE